MDLSGYKKVSYEQMQRELQKNRVDKDIHELNLAASIGLKSVGSIRNCFDIKEQLASDEVLTKLFKELEFDGLIIWSNGERIYLIRK